MSRFPPNFSQSLREKSGSAAAELYYLNLMVAYKVKLGLVRSSRYWPRGPMNFSKREVGKEGEWL